MDIVSQVEKHPLPGQTITGKDFLYVPGGKGANQAVATRRMGTSVQMAGMVGKDPFADTLLNFYLFEGIDTQHVSVDNEHPTGAAFVAVDSASENVIYVSAGANSRLSSLHIEAIVISGDDVVSATLETPVSSTKRAFEKAREVGATTVLNAAPAQKEAEELFPLTDYLIVNETELAYFGAIDPISSKEEAQEVMKDLAARFEMNIITTLGSKGAASYLNREAFNVDGYVVKAVDSTGAGDCFVGAFVSMLVEKRGAKDAIEFANAAAAVKVQKLGASSMPLRANVDSFLNQRAVTL